MCRAVAIFGTISDIYCTNRIIYWPPFVQILRNVLITKFVRMYIQSDIARGTCNCDFTNYERERDTKGEDVLEENELETNKQHREKQFARSCASTLMRI